MNSLSYKQHYLVNLRLAIPIAISQAGQMLTTIVDNIMVGHVNTVSLAACAFASSVFSILFVAGVGFSLGLTGVVGQVYGEKQYEKIGDILRHGLLLNIAIGIFLSALLWCISLFFNQMGQAAGVVEKAETYYHILNLSVLPTMIFFAFRQFTHGINSTKPDMVFTVLSNLVNVLLNYLMIFGHGGFEAMGLEGAGWATLLSRIVAAGGLISYLIYSRKYRIYFSNFYQKTLDYQLFKKIFFAGLASGFQLFIEVAAFAIGTVLIGKINEVVQAAHQIALNIVSLTFMMSTGVASATMIRTSNLLGEKNYREMRKATFAGLHLVIVKMLFFAIVIIFIRHQIPLLYTEDQLVAPIATSLLAVAVWFQIFDGAQAVALAALRGIGDEKIPTFLTLISHWVINLSLGAWLAFGINLGAIGIWYGYLLGLGFASFAYVLRFDSLCQQFIRRQAH